MWIFAMIWKQKCWVRPGQFLLSGECLLVAWKMLDCACLPESAFLFAHAQPLMSLDKGAKLCSLCICIYICTCICNFPSWISKSQLTSALFSQERGKLDGLLASSGKLEGFLTSVEKKRANKKMFQPSKEKRSNYLFSVKHRTEFADEVNERVPFLNGGANTGWFNGEVPYRIQEMWVRATKLNVRWETGKHRREKKGDGKMPWCHDRKVHRHQLTLAGFLCGGSHEICRTGEYLGTIIFRWSVISNDAHLQYPIQGLADFCREQSPVWEQRNEEWEWKVQQSEYCERMRR